MTDLFALADEMGEPVVTKTGKVLTEIDLQALVDEAEAGYDVARLQPSPPAPPQARPVRLWRYPCGRCSGNVSIRPTGDPGRPCMMVCDTCGLRTIECTCERNK